MKEISASDLMKESPRAFFLRSIRGMLPKNKLVEHFNENIVVFDGPNHDLHHIGLPQFETLKPLNFDEMFGMTIDKEKDFAIVTADTDPEEVKKLKAEGYKVKEDRESHLREYMKTKAYTSLNHNTYEKLKQKIFNKRLKKWRIIKMKNFQYQ